MPQPEPNLWLGAFVFAGATASLATWLLLIARYGRGPYLDFQPRRPVPWGPLATLLAILLVFAAFMQDPKVDLSEFTTTYDLVQRIAMGTLQVFFLTGLFFAVVVAASGATQCDLGLPELASDLGHDMRIGAVVCLAALVPVIGLQALIVTIIGQPSQHPLVKMVLQDPHPVVMGLSLVAAVVIAPVCEEIAFRLLLQGWLEKWEDRWVNPTQKLEQTLIAEDKETGGQGDKECLDPDASPCLPVSLSPCPPARGLLGLPRGWVPIGVSSLLFALAHVGHGSDPVPLFLLALMLGYTYQRTHHIVPSIVTHMLFNLVSLIALGLTIYAR